MKAVLKYLLFVAALVLTMFVLSIVCNTVLFLLFDGFETKAAIDKAWEWIVVVLIIATVPTVAIMTYVINLAPSRLNGALIIMCYAFLMLYPTEGDKTEPVMHLIKFANCAYLIIWCIIVIRESKKDVETPSSDTANIDEEAETLINSDEPKRPLTPEAKREGVRNLMALVREAKGMPALPEHEKLTQPEVDARAQAREALAEFRAARQKRKEQE
jgi:hypothetical protein